MPSAPVLAASSWASTPPCRLPVPSEGRDVASLGDRAGATAPPPPVAADKDGDAMAGLESLSRDGPAKDTSTAGGRFGECPALGSTALPPPPDSSWLVCLIVGSLETSSVSTARYDGWLLPGPAALEAPSSASWWSAVRREVVLRPASPPLRTGSPLRPGTDGRAADNERPSLLLPSGRSSLLSVTRLGLYVRERHGSSSTPAAADWRRGVAMKV